MPESAVADRYARALLDLAREEGLVERIASDLQSFGAVLGGTDLLGALAHPGFTAAERHGVLNAVLERLQLHPHSGNFLRVVLDKGRFSVLPDILAAYQRRADAVAGRVRARVTTAVELSPELGREVRTALERATGKTVLVESVVDPLIIGGVVAEVEGRVIDASLRTRLVRLRQDLINSNPDLAVDSK